MYCRLILSGNDIFSLEAIDKIDSCNRDIVPSLKDHAEKISGRKVDRMYVVNSYKGKFAQDSQKAERHTSNTDIHYSIFEDINKKVIAVFFVGEIYEES